MNRYIFIDAYSPPFPRAVQIVDAEESPQFTPPGPSGYWIEVSIDTPVQVGWKGDYVGNGWVFTELTYQDNVVVLDIRVRQLLTQAASWLTVNPLQYKLDLGVASTSETELLLGYKQYCIAVSEIKNQPSYPYTINWPVAPF
ncbi:tail fiber assembly protein [Pseudomonas rustica]|uniref:tail fiber assembly protein n=1 Tax=Pseudomonas rustica TaxID=2827099 RepID=UPI001BB0614E|nr:tail fiber assembly protein [Pseudomonas rustica]MBS4086729.1 tail fiber assembly protein [Pseudomonas rustica]